MRTIPHSRPSLGAEEIKRVVATLKSGQIAQGRIVEKSEKAFADFIGVKGAVLFNSGTAACHLGLLALGIEKKDEVILPSYTCSALLNAILYTGAKPILCDVNSSDFNLDPLWVKKRIGKRTRAIIIPHTFGAPANLKELITFKVPLIEDISHTIGADYQGKKIGSFGKISICSFYATKMLTSGEGGIALSNDEILLKRMRDLRDYDEKENYLLRYNYKLTDIQASILLVQLKKLPFFIGRRKKIASEYHQAFSGYNIKLPSGKEHLFYRYVVQIPVGVGFIRPKITGVINSDTHQPHYLQQEYASRFTSQKLLTANVTPTSTHKGDSYTMNLEKIILLFQRKGITCRRPVYKPLHRYLHQEGFPVTEAIWHSALSLPLYPSLRKEESKRVISAAKTIFS